MLQKAWWTILDILNSFIVPILMTLIIVLVTTAGFIIYSAEAEIANPSTPELTWTEM